MCVTPSDPSPCLPASPRSSPPAPSSPLVSPWEVPVSCHSFPKQHKDSAAFLCTFPNTLFKALLVTIFFLWIFAASQMQQKSGSSTYTDIHTCGMGLVWSQPSLLKLQASKLSQVGRVPVCPAPSAWGQPLVGCLPPFHQRPQGGWEGVSVQNDSWPLLAGATFSCSCPISSKYSGYPAGLVPLFPCSNLRVCGSGSEVLTLSHPSPGHPHGSTPTPYLSTGDQAPEAQWSLPPSVLCSPTYTLTASTFSVPAWRVGHITVLQLDTQRPWDKYLGVPVSSLR